MLGLIGARRTEALLPRLRRLGPGLHQAPFRGVDWVVTDRALLCDFPALVPDGRWEGHRLRPALYRAPPPAARTGRRLRDTEGFFEEFARAAPVGHAIGPAVGRARERWLTQGRLDAAVDLAELCAEATWQSLLGVPGPPGRALLLWGRRRLGSGPADDADELVVDLLRDATRASPKLGYWAERAAAWRLDEDVAMLLAAGLAERFALPRVATLTGLTGALALSPRVADQLAATPPLRAGALLDAARLFGGPRATSGTLLAAHPSPAGPLPAGARVVVAPHLARTAPSVVPDAARLDPRRHDADPTLMALLPPGAGGADDPLLAAALDALLTLRWRAAPPRLDLDALLPLADPLRLQDLVER